ncbi:MAG: glycosyltransferase family 4 protein [Candidatus Dormibacteraceae bacterium]
MVAGVQAQYTVLEAMLPETVQVRRTAEVFPHLEGGLVERLPLAASARGTLRSSLTLLPLLATLRLDAVWSQVSLPLLPFALARGARTPIFFAIDSTPRLMSTLRPHYPDAADLTTRKGALGDRLFGVFARRCARLLPWSRWAAASMIGDYGADPARVEVVAPGVDVDRWSPGAAPPSRGPARFLFVGGDFQRKGGGLLLEAFRRLHSPCELHLVTREPPPVEPGVTIHTGLEPGDPRLLELYRSADVFVLPTLADCFSIAALEAMACGVPVITSRVGGIPEIVDDGATGALLEPGDGAALRQAMDGLAGDPTRRQRWGAAARRVAVRRFDATVQSARTAELMLAAVRGAGGASAG